MIQQTFIDRSKRRPDGQPKRYPCNTNTSVNL